MFVHNNVFYIVYIRRMDMVNVEETTTPPGWKMSAQGHPWISNETVTPLGRPKLDPKHHFTQVQQNGCLWIL